MTLIRAYEMKLLHLYLEKRRWKSDANACSRAILGAWERAVPTRIRAEACAKTGLSCILQVIGRPAD